jgi:hypothetical protein
MTKTPLAWKRFYAEERDALGARGLETLLERAPRIDVPARGAWVFPHTRLSASGELPAAVARAVVESGVESVLAIGVLHGARESEPNELRAVHGPGAPFDRGRARDEFSLDGFEALVASAARLANRRAPRIIARYPFRVGTDPTSLPGFDELVRWRDSGAALVATADPVHHGVGYATAPADCLARDAEGTRERARAWIDAQLCALAKHDFSEFVDQTTRCRSDFRDAGAVLAALVGERFRHRIVELRLVDYHDVFDVAEPTWVAGALIELRRSRTEAADGD